MKQKAADKKGVKNTSVSTLYLEIRGKTSDLEKALDRVISKLDEIIEKSRAVNIQLKSVRGVSPETQRQIAEAAARGVSKANKTK